MADPSDYISRDRELAATIREAMDREAERHQTDGQNLDHMTFAGGQVVIKIAVKRVREPVDRQFDNWWLTFEFRFEGLGAFNGLQGSVIYKGQKREVDLVAIEVHDQQLARADQSRLSQFRQLLIDVFEDPKHPPPAMPLGTVELPPEPPIALH